MEVFGSALWMIANEMGIYILAGLLIAGVVHQWVSESSIRKHLGDRNSKSVYKAALIGTPLPLCSCSVIPFAVSLRQSGASKGSTLSFLISTPITGIDSILATFGMFGWVFAFCRLFSSVGIAIAAGLIMNRFDTSSVPAKPVFALNPSASAPLVPAFKQPPLPAKKPFSFIAIFTYGFGTLFGSIAKSMAWGLMIAALITAAFPMDILKNVGDTLWVGYLAALVIAVPMYVCATEAIPIAASLMIAGISPGAAFVFLSAGPATNAATMGVVKSELGSKALAVYLGVIGVGSVLFGSVIDLLLNRLDVTLMHKTHEEYGIVSQTGAVALFGLIAWHLILPVFRKKSSECSGGSCCP